MDEDQRLAARFEEHRGELRAVAYRMLGSLAEADDAVQEAWLRFSRSDVSGVDNLGAWLTTVVGRGCLNMLRSRTTRREDPLTLHLPDPVVPPAPGTWPSCPTRSGSPSSGSWTCSRPPRGSPSCCTTCSPCPSTRSRPSSGGLRPRHASSPAGHAAGSRAPARRTATSPASGRSPTASSLAPPAAASPPPPADPA